MPNYHSDEYERLRTAHERTKGKCFNLEERNASLEREVAELRLRLSVYEPQELEEGDTTFEGKKSLIKHLCIYGFSHFCDGTPSCAGNESKRKPPCPNYTYCPIRQKRVFK